MELTPPRIFKIATPAAEPNAGRAMAQWYYGENGQQMGPIDDSGLNALIASGQIGPAVLLWREGMPNWLTLDQLRANGGIYLATTPQYYGPGMLYPVNSGLAITSLILGIVGLMSCMVFLGIPAVICGHLALSQIANSNVPMVGRGMAVGGLVCGYMGVLILVTFLATLILPFALLP
jgi:hypothetical protein